MPAPGRRAAADLLPALGQNRVDGFLRGGVAGHLLRAQNRFKLADQIGGTHDLLAQAAQEFDCAGIHHGDVHDGVVGGVLHGHAARIVEHGLQGRPPAPANWSRAPGNRAERPGGPARCDAPACAAGPGRAHSSTSAASRAPFRPAPGCARRWGRGGDGRKTASRPSRPRGAPPASPQDSYRFMIPRYALQASIIPIR